MILLVCASLPESVWKTVFLLLAKVHKGTHGCRQSLEIVARFHLDQSDIHAQIKNDTSSDQVTSRV